MRYLGGKVDLKVEVLARPGQEKRKKRKKKEEQTVLSGPKKSCLQKQVRSRLCPGRVIKEGESHRKINQQQTEENALEKTGYTQDKEIEKNLCSLKE